MIEFPPIPDWDGLHPLVVHFPVALLLVAPLFILLGLAFRSERGQPFLVTALLLMLLGTAGTFLAISTGEAAEGIAERQGAPGAGAVLEHHEELAETTRTFFIALTIAFAFILFVPGMLRIRLARGPFTVAMLIFLAFYSVGALFLANTAHNGGRLVHEMGVRAMAPAPPPAAAVAPARN